ncbi:MAG: PDZ domain-containing protein [Opitutaceae bacterium]
MAERSAWRRWTILTAAASAACAAGLLEAAPSGDVLDLQVRLTELYQEHSNAIVRVKVATEDLDENGKPRISLLVFSGFFVSPEGLVLTNSTATTQANRIWVEKNGLSYLAESIGNDPRTNVGLLQVLKLPRSFSHIPLETTTESPEIGSLVMAITSPLDFNPTPSIGLVTGSESSFSNFVFPFTYLRVGIPGGPAEGGSPILNLEGQLVGISVASVPEVRSSYVVPTRALVRLHEQLKTAGTVRYGALPIEFSERPDRLNVAKEIYVSQVNPESSAGKAGLKEGDVLRSINEEPLTSLSMLRDAIFFSEIGSFLRLEINREDKTLGFALPIEPLSEISRPSTTTNPATPDAAASSPRD